MATVESSVAITAGVEQSRVSNSVSSRQESAEIIDRQTRISTAAAIDEANTTSIERSRISNSPSVEIPRDFIRITSTIGKNDIRGNLTESRAIELYEKIARLL